MVAKDYTLFAHPFPPMIFQKFFPFLAHFVLYFLAHSQYEDHVCWVLDATELFKYLIVGEWFGQTIVTEIVEVEDASYFDMFSEATVGKSCWWTVVRS